VQFFIPNFKRYPKARGLIIRWSSTTLFRERIKFNRNNCRETRCFVRGWPFLPGSIIDANARRVNANPEYYRERQQITEHQFGTLKRQRGYTHTNIRGKDRVLGEVGILFIGYNLRRCVSILSVEGLIKALKKSCLPVLSLKIRLILSPYTPFLIPETKIAV
jgi:hypothetical protein